MMGCGRKQGTNISGCGLLSLEPLPCRVCLVVMVMVMASAVVDVSGQAPCSLNDVVVMDDFDVSRFMGKWYEIEWIAPTFQDSGKTWINFYNVYNADDFGIITGYYSGKDPKTGQCFLGGIVNLKTNNHPAKMLLYTQWSATETSLDDYWILDTDYTSYAIAYSCVDLAGDANNTCTTARSWLWGRTKSLPRDVIDRARTIFLDLCMNENLLYTTEYKGDDCEPDTSGAVATTRTNGNDILLMAQSMGLLLLMVLKSLNTEIVP